MLRKKPVMAVKILDAVLTFSINSLMQVFYDFRTCGLHSCEMRIHVVHKDGERLRSTTKLFRSAVAVSLFEHEAGLSRIHLGTAYRLAVSVVLSESKYASEPRDSRGDICIHDVRQHGIYGQRSVRGHANHSMTAPHGTRPDCDESARSCAKPGHL